MEKHQPNHTAYAPALVALTATMAQNTITTIILVVAVIAWSVMDRLVDLARYYITVQGAVELARITTSHQAK